MTQKVIPSSKRQTLSFQNRNFQAVPGTVRYETKIASKSMSTSKSGKTLLFVRTLVTFFSFFWKSQDHKCHQVAKLHCFLASHHMQPCQKKSRRWSSWRHPCKHGTPSGGRWKT